MRSSEPVLKTFLFLSRWLAAPFLVGLFLALLLLLYRFFIDLYDLALHLSSQGWHVLVVGELNLVDIALTANLILIVIFSGYQNFIHNVEAGEHRDWPAGLVDIDFGGLKQRILGSIAAIASVDALAWYLDLETTTDTAKLVWAIGFPLMFALAMVLLALADWLARRSR